MPGGNAPQITKVNRPSVQGGGQASQQNSLTKLQSVQVANLANGPAPGSVGKQYPRSNHKSFGGGPTDSTNSGSNATGSYHTNNPRKTSTSGGNQEVTLMSTQSNGSKTMQSNTSFHDSHGNTLAMQQMSS